MTPKILDCGHGPSAHSEHTTGTAHTPNGKEICWACSLEREREQMKTARYFTAYLSGDSVFGFTLTDWPGGLLANITELWQTSCGGFMRGREIYRFRATDMHGKKWYGTSPGPQMYARMHRAK